MSLPFATTAGALLAASASATPIDRRGLGFLTGGANLCFDPTGKRKCLNGKQGSFLKVLECTCDAGWAGDCCDVTEECARPRNLATIDAAEFTRASWYVQEQQEAPFQEKENFFCTTATYDDVPSNTPEEVLKNLAIGATITASNAGKLGGVNGPEDSVVLCADIADPNGKFKVAPCPVFRFAAGDLFVLGVGTNQEGQYDWAVVSGGQVSSSTSDGKCTSDSGLWLYTRQPVASEETLQEMYDLLESQNVSRERLFKVTQEGCAYDRRLKPETGGLPGPAVPLGFPGTGDRGTGN